ncbi:hypothetical protein SETIT_1G183400v2 [Setaria italica]|uniref:F-box/LRR-repeat protein 15/At3g58940/PEG3-like LRR domain-containing protein n=1 Tax=Setaria italica TaxID=4555 RepID=A0A368PLN3_SETIT|nr:hypothetical protein SETIT_1G183400v2 [Setaria italica]
MGHAKKAKVKHTVDVSSDRISSLPQEIKAKILSNLTTDMAVRASYQALGGIDSSEAFSMSGQSKFVTLVDMALSLHKGPLDTFTIHGTQSYHDVFARWMYTLSTKGPEDITIKLTSGPKYKIPSSLFSISHLYFLYLKNCSISLPKKFEGFKLLKVLKLKVFSSTDSDISNLISSMPPGINCLSIQAQAMQILEIEGNFEDLCVNAPNLVNMYLRLDNIEGYQSVPAHGDRKSYLKQTFGSPTCLRTLNVNGSFLTYLSKGCMLTKVPGVFDHLEVLCIERCLWRWTEVVAACSLFQNAPLLSELDIWVALLGLLLSLAPALEEMKIIIAEDTTDQRVFSATKKLLALPRASTKAKIIVT